MPALQGLSPRCARFRGPRFTAGGAPPHERPSRCTRCARSIFGHRRGIVLARRARDAPSLTRRRARPPPRCGPRMQPRWNRPRHRGRTSASFTPGQSRHPFPSAHSKRRRPRRCCARCSRIADCRARSLPGARRRPATKAPPITRGSSRATAPGRLSCTAGARMGQVRAVAVPRATPSEAAQAIARRHGLRPSRSSSRSRIPARSTRACSHNDVIAVGHDHAVLSRARVARRQRGAGGARARVGDAFRPDRRARCRCHRGRSGHLSLQQPAPRGGRRAAAGRTRRVPRASARVVLSRSGRRERRHCRSGDVRLRQSMRNGGGPCLRLRLR